MDENEKKALVKELTAVLNKSYGIRDSELSQGYRWAISAAIKIVEGAPIEAARHASYAIRHIDLRNRPRLS